MDSARFDALTRALSEGLTRRTLTRLMGGLTLGLLPPTALEAKKNGKDTKDDNAKKDGKGHRKPDTDRPKPGNAERTSGKHGHTTGKTDKGKSDTDTTGRHDTAEPATDTTGGDEATAPRDRKTGKPDTDETPTASTARDETSDLQATDGMVTTSATSETCRPAGEPCTRDRQCCSRRCSGKHVCKCTTGSPCPAGQTCQNGRCVCPDGTKACNGGCIPSSDCCGNADCASNQVCQSGACVCPVGTTACGTSCVNTQTNPNHCGACGVACDGGTGTCKGGTCATSEVCDGVDNDFDGAVDEGTLCPANQVCRSGRCGCPDGTRDCNGDDRCEQLGTNEHCADCNDACNGGRVCENKTCVCRTGTHDCGNQGCAPFGTNQHCAGCTDQCTNSQVCCNGTCVAFFKCCYNNGLLCGGDLTCNGEQCVCPEGRHDCGNQRCVPFGTDQHCSGCTDACGGGQVCVDGVCTCDGTRCGDKCPCPDGYLCRQHCVDSACQEYYRACVCDPSSYCGTACACPDEQICVRRQCHADPTYCTTDDECSGGRLCWDGVCLCDSNPWGRCGSDCPCYSGGTCQNGQCVCTGEFCYDYQYGFEFCCPAGQFCHYDLTGTRAWCVTL